MESLIVWEEKMSIVLTVVVPMEQLDWLVVGLHMKAEWSCAVVGNKKH